MMRVGKLLVPFIQGLDINPFSPPLLRERSVSYSQDPGEKCLWVIQAPDSFYNIETNLLRQVFGQHRITDSAREIYMNWPVIKLEHAIQGDAIPTARSIYQFA